MIAVGRELVTHATHIQPAGDNHQLVTVEGETPAYH